MKHSASSRSAFTLVEMLVVIVIISLLAVALVTGLKAARRQAHAALCQAHMRNLHQACMNFLADNEHYPYAGSYEFFNRHTQRYSERRGWVAWLHEDDETEGEEIPYNPWADDPTTSHADSYIHSGWQGNDAIRSIRKGSIFRYASRDVSSYACKQFGEKDAYRTYAMNAWFGSRRLERGGPVSPLRDLRNVEPSRMGYIIELVKEPLPSTRARGEAGGGKVASRPVLAYDSVWEPAYDEPFGRHHPKAGSVHGHIVFVDGHIESLSDRGNGRDDDFATQIRKLGNGTY